jgi:hypothetical protein
MFCSAHNRAIRVRTPASRSGRRAAGVSHLLSREQRPFDCGEIVAGLNNKHLDFRMSVLKTVDGEKMNVAISTICTVHNLFGKIYCASSFRFTGTASSR